MFNDAKLIRSLDDLHVVRRVATGGFADVYLVRQKPAAGRYYALKAVRKADIAEAGLENQVLSEKRLLEAVSHNFIVKLHCTFQSKGLLFFVLEYIAGGDLYHALQRAGMFTESEARFYAAEIVVVFEYLHARDIIYRDLKLENILLDSTGHIKLADFGFAKHVPTTTLSFCGTPDYMAPEIIVERPYGKAVDWWSLGVLIFELLSGKTPFRGDSVKEIYLNVLDGEIQWTESLRDHARSIVSALLVHNPDLRLGSAGGASEIKAHTWFWGLDWAAIASRSLVPPIQPHSVPPIAIERSVQNPDDVLDELLIDDMAAVADDFEIDDF
nr:hypothetical protein HK105_008125 [Polyrhizophydium stewartii]